MSPSRLARIALRNANRAKLFQLASGGVLSKRQAKAGRKTCQRMRVEHSRSMLDMGAPAGHKMPVNDERTKVLLAAWRRRRK